MCDIVRETLVSLMTQPAQRSMFDIVRETYASLITQPAQRSHATDNLTNFTVLKFRGEFHRILLVLLLCKFYTVCFFVHLCLYHYRTAAALFTKLLDDGLVRPKLVGDA